MRGFSVSSTLYFSVIAISSPLLVCVSLSPAFSLIPRSEMKHISKNKNNMATFNTFLKRGKLWERHESGLGVQCRWAQSTSKTAQNQRLRNGEQRATTSFRKRKQIDRKFVNILPYSLAYGHIKGTLDKFSNLILAPWLGIALGVLRAPCGTGQRTWPDIANRILNQVHFLYYFVFPELLLKKDATDIPLSIPPPVPTDFTALSAPRHQK